MVATKRSWVRPPQGVAILFFLAKRREEKRGRWRGGRRGGGKEVQEGGQGRQRSRSLVIFLFLFLLCSFLSFFFVQLKLSRARVRSLLRSQFRPSLPMVGLPWPLGGGGQRKQATTTTIPSCSSIPTFSPSTASPAVSAAHAAPGHLPIRVDPQTAQQVWQGWGTSLCWWANVVGEAKEMTN